jgi:DNA-binding transcriptional LysR family regulator
VLDGRRAGQSVCRFNLSQLDEVAAIHRAESTDGMQHARLLPRSCDPLPPRFVARLAVFTDLFTRPTWLNVLTLLAGVILAPGRRTVTAALRILGRERDRDFCTFHRVLNRVAWSSRAAAVAVTQQISRGMSGEIRVGFTESGCFHPAVTRTVLEFRKTYPGLHLTLEETSSTDLVAMVREGTLDAAFIRPPFQPDPVIAHTALLEEDMIIAIPKAHRLAARKSANLRELSEETFIFYHRRIRPGLTDAVIAACERSGFHPRLGQEAPQLTSTLNLVAAGLGVSIVPESLRHLRTNEIAYLRLTGDGPRAAIGLVSRDDRRSAAVENFVSLARPIAQEHKSDRPVAKQRRTNPKRRTP